MTHGGGVSVGQGSAGRVCSKQQGRVWRRKKAGSGCLIKKNYPEEGNMCLGHVYEQWQGGTAKQG